MYILSVISCTFSQRYIYIYIYIYVEREREIIHNHIGLKKTYFHTLIEKLYLIHLF